jgi:hypothetical protein
MCVTEKGSKSKALEKKKCSSQKLKITLIMLPDENENQFFISNRISSLL